MPCLAAEVRFLHYTFLSGHRLAGSILHTEQQFSFVHRQSTDHRKSTIDNRQTIKKWKNCLSNQSLHLVVSTSKKTFQQQNKKTYSCFFVLLFSTCTHTNNNFLLLYLQTKTKLPYYLLASRTQSGYLLQVSDQKYKLYISFRYKTTTNIIFLKASILILFLF